MNLKMVTWDLDYMQFLVNADTNEDAINRAIGINLSYAPIDDEIQFEDINDPTTYSVDDVDYKFLTELFERRDIIGVIDNVVVFSGN